MLTQGARASVQLKTEQEFLLERKRALRGNPMCHHQRQARAPGRLGRPLCAMPLRRMSLSDAPTAPPCCTRASERAAP